MRLPWLFLAQAASHAIWYLDVRAAQRSHTLAACGLDFVYGLLTIYTYKCVLDEKAPLPAVLTFCLGGAFGTAIGMSLPV